MKTVDIPGWSQDSMQERLNFTGACRSLFSSILGAGDE
jgi:hypothetical protein